MKKQAKFFVVILFLAAVLLGCRENPDKQLKKEAEQKTAFEQKGVVMETEKAEYAPDKGEITYAIFNNSGQEVMFSKHFTLEKQINETWRSVPFKEGVAFIEVALMIAPGESVSETIPLHLFKQPLSEGRYRIVKKISGRNVAAEFQIVN